MNFNHYFTSKKELEKNIDGWAKTHNCHQDLNNVTVNIYNDLTNTKYIATYGCYQSGADIKLNYKIFKRLPAKVILKNKECRNWNQFLWESN